MAKMKRLTVEQARADLGRMVDAGVEGKLEEHSPISKHGRVGIVAVPIDWYRKMRELSGDPTDL